MKKNSKIKSGTSWSSVTGLQSPGKLFCKVNLEESSLLRLIQNEETLELLWFMQVLASAVHFNRLAHAPSVCHHNATLSACVLLQDNLCSL